MGPHSENYVSKKGVEKAGNYEALIEPLWSYLACFKIGIST